MRDRTKLHPILQYKIDRLLELCNQNGLKIGISECVRTVQEQDALYAKGRTAPGGIVTNAKGSCYQSLHQWGVAFDFYLMFDVDGDGQTKDDAFNDSHGDFKKVAKYATMLGLEWGGSWTSIIDKPHLQLPYWGSGSSLLRSKYGTPSKFDELWYPNKPTKAVMQGSCRDDILWVQLQILKLTSINMMPDGIWGPKTANAVAKYQKTLGWDGDSGKAGAKTIAALSKNSCFIKRKSEIEKAQIL